MISQIIENFLPWIAFFILAGKSQTQLSIAIISAAVCSLFFERRGLRRGYVLSWGTLLYFLFMFVFVVLLKSAWVAERIWIFSNGTLATIAWISLIIRKPFTLQYAKNQVAKEKWSHPVFIKLNTILSLAWACIFLACTGLHLVQLWNPNIPGWIFELMSDLATIFGIWLTIWFPRWYQKVKR